jgi:hypothetical protein
MKFAIAVIVALAWMPVLVGCGNTYVIDGKSTKAADLSPTQKVEVLRDAARKQHLKWYVFCVPDTNGNTSHYQAVAKQEGEPDGALFIEDGAHPYWSATGATPEDAALNLREELRHSANFDPMHKQAELPTGNCSYQTVLDSEHDGQLACVTH